MNLPLDIPALLKAATDIDEARNTPLAVSVYIDETAPGDVVGHVRSAFASAGAKTRVTIGYLDDNLLAEPYGADDMAVIVAGDSPRIGEQAFDSLRKRMTTVHQTPAGSVSYTKGATDLLLGRCTCLLEHG